MIADAPVAGKQILLVDDDEICRDATAALLRASGYVVQVAPDHRAGIAGEYRRLSARWQRLAADATTPQTRNHLLKLARQCEFLAGNIDQMRDEIEGLGSSA